MIYFLTEPETEGSYFKSYNSAIRKTFIKKGIGFKEVKLKGAYFSKENRKLIDKIKVNSKDIWLLSYAHNPIIKYIAEKPGKKFGHVHGSETTLYEPAVLNGYSLDEENIFNLYDGLFLNSNYSKDLILRAYSNLSPKVIVSGFPFDYKAFVKYKYIRKKKNYIVFNQRFSIDKLHIIVVYLSEILIKKGYKVFLLSSSQDMKRIQKDRESRVLLKEAEKRGLRVLVNQTKHQYYSRLAKANFVISTSLAETLSISTLEAIALNVTPLAPDFGPFREYLNEEHLYSPYNIDEIIEKLNRSSKSKILLDKYLPEKVAETYIKAMEGI